MIRWHDNVGYETSEDKHLVRNSAQLFALFIKNNDLGKEGFSFQLETCECSVPICKFRETFTSSQFNLEGSEKMHPIQTGLVAFILVFIFFKLFEKSVFFLLPFYKSNYIYIFLFWTILLYFSIIELNYSKISFSAYISFLLLMVPRIIPVSKSWLRASTMNDDSETGSCTLTLQMAWFTQRYSNLFCKDNSRSKKVQGINSS